jgi:hypothetical protein
LLYAKLTKPAGLKAWVANKQQNNETPQALHALLFSWTGTQYGKANAKLEALARCKASKCQPHLKAWSPFVTNKGKASMTLAALARCKASKSHPALKHGHNKQQTIRLPKQCIPCCFEGPENLKAKLVKS